MMKIELLNVKYHDRIVGTLSLTPDNKLCAFEYDRGGWLMALAFPHWNCRYAQACFWRNPPLSLVILVSLKTACLMAMVVICFTSCYRRKV